MRGEPVAIDEPLEVRDEAAYTSALISFANYRWQQAHLGVLGLRLLLRRASGFFGGLDLYIRCAIEASQ